MSTLLLIALALAALCRLLVIAPTATSPSSEDFTGLTLVSVTLVASKLVPTWLLQAVEPFDVKNTTDYTWDASMAVDAGSLYKDGLNSTRTYIVRNAAFNFSDNWRHVFTVHPDNSWPMMTISPTGKNAGNYAYVDKSSADGACWVSYPSMPFSISSAITRTIGYPAVSRVIKCDGAYLWFGDTYDGVDYFRARCPIATIGGATYKIGLSANWTTAHVATELGHYPTNSVAFSAELPAASGFTPSGGANLGAYVSLTPTLDSTGASGTVRLYCQHYTTAAGWCSLGGVADAWTDLGLATSGVPITGALAATECRAGEKFRWKAEFTSTDGTLPPPALSGLALAWTSNTSAPGVPTITQLISAVGPGGTRPGARLDLGAITTGARHLEVEIDRKPAGGSWAGALPVSSRRALEAGQGYLALRGPLAAGEAAGEDNSLSLDIPGTLAVGDQVRARARAVSAMGVASAWTDTTAAVEIAEPLGAAPTVTAAETQPFAEGGGTEITITGTGFETGATVSLGGTACTEVVVVSGTEITATTPIAAYGPATLSVTNPDGQTGSLAVQVGTAEYVPVLTDNWRATWGTLPWRAVWR